MRTTLAALACALLLACADQEILHRLDETQANRVLVALHDAGIQGRAERGEGDDAGWTVAVPTDDVSRARRALSERELPRQRPAGFAEVFSRGSLVHTPVEERALYHHALAGELARSLETLDGVLEARVHLALPAPDALRPDLVRPPRAAVLLKVRSDARARLDPLTDGIRSLVAGAAEGLEPPSVSVVMSEAAAPSAPPAAPRRPSPLLLGLAAAAALSGLSLAGLAVRRRLRPGGA